MQLGRFREVKKAVTKGNSFHLTAIWPVWSLQSPYAKNFAHLRYEEVPDLSSIPDGKPNYPESAS